MVYETLNVSFTVFSLVKYLSIKIFFRRWNLSWRYESMKQFIFAKICIMQHIKDISKTVRNCLYFFNWYIKKLHAFEVNLFIFFGYTFRMYESFVFCCCLFSSLFYFIFFLIRYILTIWNCQPLSLFEMNILIILISK